MRVCVFIGEGSHERYFLPSLLENSFNFKHFVFSKSPFLFRRGDIVWCFVFPPCESCPTGGNNRLKNIGTYKMSNSLMHGNRYLFSKDTTYHYVVLFDTDGMPKIDVEKFRSNITTLIEGYKKKANQFLMDSQQVISVNKEIESWYLAGLTHKFPLFIKDKSTVDKLLSQDSEKLHDPKEAFEGIILEEYKQSTIKISTEAGKHFDVSQAQKKSKSFNNFIELLSKDNLI